MKGLGFAKASAAELEAGRNNMLLLIQLRWIAVCGQLLTIEIVYGENLITGY